MLRSYCVRSFLLYPMLASCSTGPKDPRQDLTIVHALPLEIAPSQNLDALKSFAEPDAGPAPDGKKHKRTGHASWYGKRHHGRTTASGEPFDMHAFTAAHKTMPFHTIVRVTDPQTQKSVVVRINDRGPYGKGRVIDLSKAAAADLDMIKKGTMAVTLKVLTWGDGSRSYRK